MSCARLGKPPRKIANRRNGGFGERFAGRAIGVTIGRGHSLTGRRNWHGGSATEAARGDRAAGVIEPGDLAAGIDGPRRSAGWAAEYPLHHGGRSRGACAVVLWK